MALAVADEDSFQLGGLIDPVCVPPRGLLGPPGNLLACFQELTS